MVSVARQKVLDKFDLIQDEGILLDTPCDTCAKLGKVCKMLPRASKKCGHCVKQNSPGCSQMGWNPPPPGPAQEEKEDEEMADVGDDAATDHTAPGTRELSPAFQVVIHQLASPRQPAAALQPAQHPEKKKLPLHYSKAGNKYHVHLTKAEGYRLPLLPRENQYTDFWVEDNDLEIEKAVGSHKEDVRNVIWLKAGWYAVFGVNIDGKSMDAALILPRNDDGINMEEEVAKAKEGNHHIAHLKADKYAIVAIRVSGLMKSGAIILPLDENPIYDVDDKTFEKLLPKGASSYRGGLDVDHEGFERHETEGPKGRRQKVFGKSGEGGKPRYVHSLQPKSGKAEYQNGMRIR